MLAKVWARCSLGNCQNFGSFTIIPCWQAYACFPASVVRRQVSETSCIRAANRARVVPFSPEEEKKIHKVSVCTKV